MAIIFCATLAYLYIYIDIGYIIIWFHLVLYITAHLIAFV
jgi:hypothetical protein